MTTTAKLPDLKTTAPRGKVSAVADIFERPAAASLTAVVILCVVMLFLSPNFGNYGNLSATALAFSYIAIAATGQLTVIVMKGIDISVGSVMGLSGIVTAMMSSAHLPDVVALAGGLGAGLLVGLANGYLISYLGLTAFMVTLGGLNVVRGIDVVITGGMPVNGMSQSLQFLGSGYILDVPVPVWITVVVAVVWSTVLTRTPYGRHVYAIGGNENASNLAGVRVKRVKFWGYVVCSLMAGLAGILLTAQLGVGEATAGTGYELNIIAAAVIGGASFLGGVGNVLGAVCGAALLGLVVDAMGLLGVNAYYQQIVVGSVILIAVILDRIRTPKAKR